MEKANECSWQITNLTTGENSMELIVQTSPDTPPSRIASQLRAYTSKVLRNEYEVLKKLATLWSAEYYIITVGEVLEEPCNQYMLSQRNK